MCNQYLSWSRIGAAFNQNPEDIKALLNFSNDKLEPFVTDNLLEYNDDEIIISDLGRFVLRNIAAVFDIHVGDPNRKFSKSV